MNNLEVHQSPVSQWVESIHILKFNDHRDLQSDRMIRDYELRIKETKRKIASLTTKLELLIHRNVIMGADHRDWVVHLQLIWSALDVYTVQRMGNDIWTGLYRTSLGGIVGVIQQLEWWDYLGNQSIRESGGTIVLMLSNEGVTYLNGIDKKVSFLSSSPDKRYYTTVTI